MFAIKELQQLNKFVCIEMPSRRSVFNKMRSVDTRDLHYKQEADFTNKVAERPLSTVEAFDRGKNDLGQKFLEDLHAKNLPPDDQTSVDESDTPPSK